MPGPTTFHLIRHAAHGLLPHVLAGRMPGVGLSPQGQAQAAALGRHFATTPLDAILTSPVQRAIETATALDPARTPEIEPGFNEIDFGTWTGQRFDALAPDPAWQGWNTLRSLSRCPGGETMAEAQSRALSALQRHRAARPNQVLAIVSHADIIKSIVAAVLGLGLDGLMRFDIDPASISTVIIDDHAWRVAAMNVPVLSSGM